MRLIIHTRRDPEGRGEFRARRAAAGRTKVFHGSFTSKADAQAKERETPGSYVQRTKGKGGEVRYLVLTRKGK